MQNDKEAFDFLQYQFEELEKASSKKERSQNSKKRKRCCSANKKTLRMPLKVGFLPLASKRKFTGPIKQFETTIQRAKRDIQLAVRI